MHILFISPAVSENYMTHVESIARKGWRGVKFLKRDIKRNERIVGKSFYCQGLLTLASRLPRGTTFTFVDENFDKDRLQTTIGRNEYDLAAITAQLIQAERARQLIKTFLDRGVHVVIGGAHPTTFSDDYIQPGVSVVQGEGEDPFARFLNDFTSGTHQALYKSDNRRGADLNNSPVPDYSLVSHHRYSLAGVQTTRGCPYRCRFCSVSNISGEAYRHKPVEQVKEEVRQVKRLWPKSMFFFFDDNTFADREYAYALFEALQEVKLGNWIAHADISVSEDTELLDLVATNGSPFFSIGFETLWRENAETIGNKMKAGYLSRYEDSIDRIHKKNITVGGSFMFGFKGDSKSRLEEIMAFIRQNHLQAYVTRYAALPGTRLYEELLDEYQRANGSMPQKGTLQAGIINRYFMQKNGFDVNETEDMIIDILKKSTTTELPMVAIDALATYRCFFS